MKTFKNSKKGVTLVEVIVSVCVLAVMASGILVGFGYANDKSVEIVNNTADNLKLNSAVDRAISAIANSVEIGDDENTELYLEFFLDKDQQEKVRPIDSDKDGKYELDTAVGGSYDRDFAGAHTAGNIYYDLIPLHADEIKKEGGATKTEEDDTDPPTDVVGFYVTVRLYSDETNYIESKSFASWVSGKFRA